MLLGSPGPCLPVPVPGTKTHTGTRVGRQGHEKRRAAAAAAASGDCVWTGPGAPFYPGLVRAGVPARGSGAASKRAGRGRDGSEGGTPRGSAFEPAPPGAGGWEPRGGALGRRERGTAMGTRERQIRRDRRRERTGNGDPEGDLGPLQEPPPAGVSVRGGATVFTTTTGPLLCFLPALGCWASPWHPIVRLPSVGCSPDLVGTS